MTRRFSLVKNTVLILLALFLVQCHTREKKHKGFRYEHTRRVEERRNDPVEVPVDMNNKGIGPFKEVFFPKEINQDMVAKGKILFREKCMVCHLPEKRMIGPAVKGVYERRSEEWVMNMMINPLEMLKKDPIAKALQKEYNGAIMVNVSITEEEARALAEYLRTL